MKAFLFTLLFASACFAQRQNTGFGLGAMLGDPTAISFKGHLGNLRYFDVAVANNMGPADDLYVHGDYIVERQNLFNIEEAVFDLYYGIGARAYFADTRKKKSEFYLGPRAPIGLSYYLNDPSVEFFGELAVIIEVIPEMDSDLDVSIGARYWF